MRKLLSLGTAVAAVALASMAYGYPNFNAATGIVAVPNALILPTGSSQGAADIITFDNTTLNARVLYGVSDRLEVGAALVVGENDGLGVSAKYRIPTGTAGPIAWAIGGSVIAANDSDASWQIYGAASRRFGAEPNTSLLGTAGVTLTDTDGGSALRPFLGAQLGVGANLELAAEYQFSGINPFDEEVSSLLVRYYLAGSRATVQTGFTNATGFLGRGEHSWFFGASVPLTGGSVAR